ncbi:MAG: polysaccharide biosynthesis/export family protein [Pseudomonadota bacterium]
MFPFPVTRSLLTLPLVFTLTVGSALAVEKERPPENSASVEEMNLLPEQSETSSSAVILDEDDYRIGPADELEIEVFQVDELSGVEKVNSRGYIRMPLLGPVKVAGLTTEQAEDLLADLYGVDYLQDPQVNIDIADYASQQVTLLGAVDEPGVYPLKGRTTLLQALALAGGTERLADEEEIVVFRTNDGGEVVGYIVNLEEILSGSKPDPEVIGNDRIVVPESGSKSFVKGVSDTLRGFIGFRVW